MLDEYVALLDRFGFLVRSALRHLGDLHAANDYRRRNYESEVLTSEYWVGKEPLTDLHVETLEPLHKDYLPEESFYVDCSSNLMLLELDFLAYQTNGRSIYGLVRTSCCLDPNNQSRLIAYDSRQQQMDRGRVISLGPIFFMPYLSIEVRREHILDDALNKLVLAQVWEGYESLKSPLKVKFIGEEGIDEGGVAKEFFQLLVEQIMNPDYGMFCYLDQTHLFWFMTDAFGTPVQFELVGIILGLAVYNYVILDIHFPHVVYKKLLSANPTIAEKLKPVADPTGSETTGETSGDTTAGGNGETAASSTQPTAGTAQPAGAIRHWNRPRAPGSGQVPGVDMNVPFIGRLCAPEEESFDMASTDYAEAKKMTTQQIVYWMASGQVEYKPTIEDLAELYPDVAKGLRQLLKMPGSDVEALMLTFAVTVDRFGQMIDIPLKLGDKVYDPEEPVTEHNREEYVQAVLQYHLIDSIDKEFSAFYRGFHRACGGPTLCRLCPVELHLLICGAPGDLDFKSLREGARYVDGYTDSSPQIQWFWQICEDSFTQDDKKKLLFFITGSDRTPVGTLASLKLTISKAGGEIDRLPTAHTCFNHLLLPPYKSKADLEKFLRIAMEYRHGFGLR